MTAWIYLGLVIMSGVGMFGTYMKGAQDAEYRILAQQLSIEQVAERAASEAKEGMLNAVVEAVKTVRVQNKTYIQNFKEVERENVVYRECKHSDDALRLLNSALRGDSLPSESAVQSKLPD